MFMFWIVLFKLCYAQYRAVINQNVFSFIYNGDTYRYNISTIQKTLVSQPDSVVTA